jgi:hypothetical protein
MSNRLTDDQLRHTALTLLEKELGPVETLRFLAMVRREPFDYQAWRDDRFAGLTVEDLFRRMQAMEATPQSRPPRESVA